MSQIIHARFEDGVLKPEDPLDLPPNARVLRLGPAQPNAKASLPSAAFATAARAFAEREARKADLID